MRHEPLCLKINNSVAQGLRRTNQNNSVVDPAFKFHQVFADAWANHAAAIGRRKHRTVRCAADQPTIGSKKIVGDEIQGMALMRTNIRIGINL